MRKYLFTFTLNGLNVIVKHMSFVSQILGDHNQRVLNKIRPLVEKIDQLEKDFEKFSDSQLKDKTSEFRQRLVKGETLDDLLAEAFATVREASKRTIGLRHFDVQLIGGIVLHQGKIAEMKTGEGKTLAATLAVYLNALEGKGVQVVTVNDYLAKRDVNWMGPIYNLLGMGIGCIQHDKAFLFQPQGAPDSNEVTVEMENLREVPRRLAYEADITYGTNNEFGFDYLRDNMVQDLSQMAQREHHYAIVDEVDSILIDEARTPLIISAPDAESTKLYETFTKIIPKLNEKEDYEIDEKMKSVTLTEDGIEKVEKILGMDIYTEGGVKYVHQLEQALRAHSLFKLDIDYVVKDGEVIIVDEFTGRLMFGRRYSGGLHQAIEAKEGVRVQEESRTLATITFQNYFRMYKKLAGMTGTALTNAEEFNKVYNLDVVVIPTNQTVARNDLPDRIYRSEKGKFKAVVEEIKERHQKGQPVLVGTVSIEKNELLGALLKCEGIPYQILNAKNHEKEAQIIANAGRKGTVTVATNMAGRGVDIILGGRVELVLGPAKLGDSGDEAGKKDWQAEHDEVVALGGLHIIGTERHEARRIDNQLRGRAGRQGDPGSTVFMVSLEDDLMRIFGSDKIKRMMEVFNLPEDQPIENKMISRALESAQAKIEGFNFDTRKHVLEYDDVMNKQRETIYRRRREILEFPISRQQLSGEHSAESGASFPIPEITSPASALGEEGGQAEKEETTPKGLREQILEMVENEIKKFVAFHAPDEYSDNWNYEEIGEIANAIIGLSKEEKEKIKEFKNREELVGYLHGLAEKKYLEKEKQFGEENMQAVEKAILLRVIDMLWMEHLDNMEHLRDSVRLRAYGQRDPLVEYKNEGHKMFQDLLSNIQAQVANMIFKVEVQPQNRAEINAEPRGKPHPSPLLTKEREQGEVSRPAFAKSSVGRNDPCPCGSGKKYKKCHGK